MIFFKALYVYSLLQVLVLLQAFKHSFLSPEHIHEGYYSTKNVSCV